MPVGEKRALLMEHRKRELRRLIDVYYEERGWTPNGVPTPETLQRLGLWDFLNEETRACLAAMVRHHPNRPERV